MLIPIETLDDPVQERRVSSIEPLQLTDKQAEVLDLVWHERLSSKEIAARLEISPRAVDQRLDAARKVLGCATRQEAAREYARLSGTSERLTSEPIHVSDFVGKSDAPGARANGPFYKFEDSIGFAPTSIPDWPRRSVPDIRPERFKRSHRLLLIAGGAVVILAIFLLGLGVVEGLSDLLL